MITRRALFLGSAAIITTPGLLMPVRKLIVPAWSESLRQVFWDWSVDSAYLAANPPLLVGVDWGNELRSDHTVITRARLIKGYVGVIDSLVIKP